MRRLIAVCCCFGLAAAGCGSSEEKTSAGGGAKPSAATSAPAGTKPKVEVPAGSAPTRLIKEDLKVGTGAVAEPGDTLTLHYVGVLYANGKQFDSSWDNGKPFTFILQAEQVIDGWDLGVEGMRVGGRRKLIIPPELAYKGQGQGGIPPNSALVFVIDLLRVQ